MLKLEAEKREIFGKKLKKARAAGKLPVVVYGRKRAPESLFVDAKIFGKLFHEAGESTLVSLGVAGAESHTTLIQDVAFHPVEGTPLHADFYIVEQDKVIQIAVPLEFTGEAPAVKEFAGTLVKVMHELEIEVLPAHLPQHLVVDLSVLKDLDHPILAKDIKLPESAMLMDNPLDIVASVSVVHEEEPTEEAAAPDLSTIEVIKKGKKEEEAPAEGLARGRSTAEGDNTAKKA